MARRDVPLLHGAQEARDRRLRDREIDPGRGSPLDPEQAVILGTPEIGPRGPDEVQRVPRLLEVGRDALPDVLDDSDAEDHRGREHRPRPALVVEGDVPGGDRDLFSGARVPADASLARFDDENPKTAQLDAIAAGEGFLH